MSQSQQLIEKLAKQKTEWLDDFKKTYSKSRSKPKQPLTVKDYNKIKEK